MSDALTGTERRKVDDGLGVKFSGSKHVVVDFGAGKMAEAQASLLLSEPWPFVGWRREKGRVSCLDTRNSGLHATCI